MLHETTQQQKLHTKGHIHKTKNMQICVHKSNIRTKICTKRKVNKVKLCATMLKKQTIRIVEKEAFRKTQRRSKNEHKAKHDECFPLY